MEDNAAEQANASLETTEVEARETEVLEEVTTEEQHVEAEQRETPEKDKPADNAEASRIGRIVKKQLERELSPFKAELEEAIATIARLTPKEQKEANLPPPPVEGFPTTPDEFVKMNEWAETVKKVKVTTQQMQYMKSYASAITSLREEGGDLHAQIQDLLTKDGSPYNVTRGTGRGDIDAALNYRIAHRDILANKVKTSASPFKGNAPDGVPKGVSASSKAPASKVTKVKFDDERAEGFAQYLNLSDEKRAEIISSRK